MRLNRTPIGFLRSVATFLRAKARIVTKDEIPDPHSLDIKLSIGGEVLQHTNTRELISRIPDRITYISPSFLSNQETSSAQELLWSGACSTPHRWLRPGETIITEIQGIGQLINPVVAEA